MIPSGRWTGQAREPGGQPFPVEVTLLPGCAMNSPCGTIATPAIPCHGRLTLIDAGPEGYEFQVDRFDAASNAAVCKPGGGEVLKAMDDGSLAYTATYSGARGLLKPAG